MIARTKERLRRMRLTRIKGKYAICLLILQLKLTNSRTSWRLNTANKVVKMTDFISTVEDDPIFDILASSVVISNGQSWSKTAISQKHEKMRIYCQECKDFTSQER